MEQPPSSTITAFSLFDDDLLNRSFSRIWLDSRRVIHVAGRCIVVVVVTWVPMAALSLFQGLYSNRLEARNFFADYAAYLQFILALPLFIIAERVVSRSTREAAGEFVDSGVIGFADLPVVDACNRKVERLRLMWSAELICIVVAYVLAGFTIIPARWSKAMHPWYSGDNTDQTAQIFTLFGLTLPGIWAILVALPILNYVWLRLAWKVAIWTRFLYWMSRLKLVLVSSHPDQTGGIGFISEVQARFALIIFAYGISNVAAVIAYKVAIEKAPLSLMPVWAPAVGFIIIAPTLFTAPLLMFTKQLFRTKRRAMALYREQVLRRALAFEAQWLSNEPVGSPDTLNEMNHLTTMFDRISRMRVVPFDFRSGLQLMASTFGSVATALPLLKIEGPLKTWLEVISAILKHGG